METCSALLAICAGNSQVPGEFPFETPSCPLLRHRNEIKIPWEFLLPDNIYRESMHFGYDNQKFTHVN